MPSNQGGNKKLKVDLDKAADLFSKWCPQTEVAAALGVSVDTLERRVWDAKKLKLAEFARECKEKGNIPLRAKQLEVALKGNVTMLIWLGKQRLDQREPDAKEREDTNKFGFNVWLKDSLKIKEVKKA